MDPLDLEAQTPAGGAMVSPAESEDGHAEISLHDPPTIHIPISSRGAVAPAGMVDRRARPSEIKHKSVTHLHLTDPVRQFGRWYFSLKSFLITEEPVFGRLLDGERGEHMYHYEWCLAKLIAYLVKDEDAQYTIGGCIRRHQQAPGTAALAGLSDTY